MTTYPCRHSDSEEHTLYCKLCQQPICEHCAQEIPQFGLVCPTCVFRIESARRAMNQTPVVPPRGIIGNAKNSPATLIFCIILGIIYFACAFPHWGQSDMGFLLWSNLDADAVIHRHEYWRLVTANFSHVNLAHLGFNVFALLIFGQLIEIQIGWKMWLLWILMSMIGCDIATIVCHVPHSVGASGIAYGLQTAFIVLAAKDMLINRTQGIWRTVRSLLGYLLIIVLINVMTNQPLNIYGHFGGALSGLVCAVAYPVTRPANRVDYVIIIAFLAMMLAILFNVIQNPQAGGVV